MILFMVIAMTFFVLLGSLLQNSVSLSGQSAAENQLVGYSAMEKLAAYNSTSGIEVFNNGSIATQIQYAVTVNEQTGQIQSLIPWQSRPIPIEGNVTLPMTLQSGESLSLITSRGNVFSVSTAAPPGKPIQTFNISIS